MAVARGDQPRATDGGDGQARRGSRAVLAPAFAQFTDGFETVDLIVAKSLLADLDVKAATRK